ncbi:hypothetical protein [Heliobacterium mobile]|nr:hypothetical protein [Heliobacterium mobile]
MTAPVIMPIPTLPEAKAELLHSIALEEVAIAHILNAEGEKIQKALTCEHKLDDLIAIDASVASVLRLLIKKEMILQFKLESTLTLPNSTHPHPHP